VEFDDLLRVLEHSLVTDVGGADGQAEVIADEPEFPGVHLAECRELDGLVAHGRNLLERGHDVGGGLGELADRVELGGEDAFGHRASPEVGALPTV